MDVDSPDERLAAGATRVPVLLVPRLLAAAAATETAYTDMPMPVTELLLMAQQRDAFATEQREKSVSGGSMEAESSPWTIGQDGLLRFSGCAYVPKDPAIRAEIMRVNHDEPQGDISAKNAPSRPRRAKFVKGQRYIAIGHTAKWNRSRTFRNSHDGLYHRTAAVALARKGL
jgi:hypothetical protein